MIRRGKGSNREGRGEGRVLLGGSRSWHWEKGQGGIVAPGGDHEGEINSCGQREGVYAMMTDEIDGSIVFVLYSW